MGIGESDSVRSMVTGPGGRGPGMVVETCVAGVCEVGLEWGVGLGLGMFDGG